MNDKFEIKRGEDGLTDQQRKDVETAEAYTAYCIEREKEMVKEKNKWKKELAKLKLLKAAEMELRKKIIGFFFPNPQEGTNNCDLSDGEKLSLSLPYERKVDEDLYNLLQKQCKEAQIPARVIKWKPTLDKKEYNKLSEDQQKIVNQMLIVKPGSPTLTIK